MSMLPPAAPAGRSGAATTDGSAGGHGIGGR
jgi:hypothetical protein